MQMQDMGLGFGADFNGNREFRSRQDGLNVRTPNVLEANFCAPKDRSVKKWHEAQKEIPVFPVGGFREFYCSFAAVYPRFFIINLKIDFSMQLKPGDKAPAFNLRASDKSQVKLSDYKGKNVLLLFVPAAFTGVCTKELCMMRDGLKDFEKVNAEVLAISVDSLFTLAKWKEEQGYNFPLLSDFNKTTAKKYGAFYKDFVFEMKGVAKRSAFVIDKKGIVRYAEVLESAGDLPNFEAIKSTLETLK